MYKYSTAIRITCLWKHLKLKVFFVYSYWSEYKMRHKNRPSEFIHTFGKFKTAYGALCNSKKALIHDGYSYDLRWQIDKYGTAMAPLLSKLVAAIWLCEKAGINAEFCTNSDELHAIFDIPKQSSLSEDILPLRCPKYIIKYVSRIPMTYKLPEKLPLRKELIKKADEWFNRYMQGEWVAVHYRGTDVVAGKATRCKRRYKIELEQYITYLRVVLDDKYNVLTCSDQAQFIDKMQAAFPGRVFAREIQRSSGGEALHRYPEYKGIQQRKDALIDMLILAKANLIYTTGSSFVDTVRYFNPKTKIVSLDERKTKAKCHIPIPRKDVFDKLKIK